jgi:hypothetical protein
LRFHPSASSSAAAGAALGGLRGKEQQDQFCTVLKTYIQARNKGPAEPNPIRRAEMHPPDPWSFEDSIAEDSIARVFGPNGEFMDWTGRLFFSVTGWDVVLTFQPACGSGSSISFTNGYPADQRASARAARIPLSSLGRTNCATLRRAACFVCRAIYLLGMVLETVTRRVQATRRMRASASKARKRIRRPMSRIHNIWRSSPIWPRQTIECLLA